MIFKLVKQVACYVLIALSLLIASASLPNQQHEQYSRYSVAAMGRIEPQTVSYEQPSQQLSVLDNDKPDYQILALPFSILALIFSVIYLRNTKKDFDNFN